MARYENDLMTSTDAAAVLGVGPSTVKRWADEGLLECVRTAGGHRRFRRRAVDDFLARQAAADGPASWAAQWVERLRSESSLQVLQGALLAEQARAGSWWRLADDVGAILEELGDQWHRGELTIVEEHVASERLNRAVSGCAAFLPTLPEAPVALLATAEGDDHESGLVLAELCLREAGWKVTWSGARTPTQELVRHAESERPDVVAVSASSWSRSESILTCQVEVLAEICRGIGAELVLGGAGRWPDDTSGAVRVRSFSELRRFLDGFRRRTGRASEA